MNAAPGAAPREDLNALSNEAFRARFRAWLAEHCPEEVRRPAERLRGAQAKSWFALLARHGWRAPGWPREYGGLGLAIDKQIIYDEELERARVARTANLGDSQLGPILIRHGSEAQRREYLPKILTCEHWWCQGYSEPNAGSDLAALRTRAVRDGGDFVVTGHKIWTSHALDSTHTFLLARSSDEPARQAGITFLLVPLDAPGVAVRPIVNLAGDDEFCEVHYDGVRVPVENAVGAVGAGWGVSRAMLGVERLFIGSPRNSRLALQLLRELGAALGLEALPRFADTLAELSLELHALVCLYRETAEAVAADRASEAQLSLLKIVATEHFQRTAEAAMALAGEYGPLGEVRLDGRAVDLRRLYMAAVPATIYGGTSEIQRNILARRLLGLPAAA
jgi:alkylation response protein AidB-like acyl-CoA dehydrogenase